MASNTQYQHDFNEPICGKLSSHFGRESLALISVGYDKQDGYSICLRLMSADLTPRLTEADVIPLLPAGSRWLPAVGWHSYFGIPFSFEDKMWLAVGAEIVNAHHSRGAYIAFCAFVFPFNRPPVRQLMQLADELEAIPPAVGRSQTAPHPVTLESSLKFIADGLRKVRLLDHDYRIIKAKSINPAEHVKVEAHIIRKAAEAYAREELLLFRTLILSENQLGQLSSPFRQKKAVASLRICYYKYLGSTVRAIASTFSSQAKNI
jgi:hypothetical protein